MTKSVLMLEIIKLDYYAQDKKTAKSDYEKDIENSRANNRSDARIRLTNNYS